MSLSTRAFISTSDLSAAELLTVLERALHGKQSNWREYSTTLSGKIIALMFFNPSLRTRASFQAGIARLGGQSVVLAPGSDSWTLEFEEGALMYRDRTEHVKDAAGVLSQYFDAVCIRSFPALKSWDEDRNEPVLSAFKKHLDIPLISMESALWHPCQALADAVTLKERFGKNLQGRKFVLTWAPHPKQLPLAVPHSTALIAAQLGMEVRLACPEGYEFEASIMGDISAAAKTARGSLEVFHEQEKALKGAEVVYAKSWSPPLFIGRREVELEHRKSLLPWMLDLKALQVGNDPYFMHCLPARRNIEVADEVIDSPRSLTEHQAANRLHAQNALLTELLTKGN
jgi:N-acetylornithine carbamoyltransferase